MINKFLSWVFKPYFNMFDLLIYTICFGQLINKYGLLSTLIVFIILLISKYIEDKAYNWKVTNE